MRLKRVYIDGFKNLKEAELIFDQSRLTTVVIGQNGAGKSNLIKSVVEVFRFADLPRQEPRFRYELEYTLRGGKVKLSNLEGSLQVFREGERVTRKELEANKKMYLPDLVFGYHSGGNRQLEQLFDSHQRRYYDAIKLSDDLVQCDEALKERRLFFCRQIHGSLALLSFFAFPSPRVQKLLKDKLGVTSFHSALCVFREPWYAQSTRKGGKGRKRLNRGMELWGARGPAGRCAANVRDSAFHPITLRDKPIDDYRDKGGEEEQMGAFLRNGEGLQTLSDYFENDAEMFAALESMDISDLVRDFHLWVGRVNDPSGDVSFSDLSDGERQLLMVLGLIRISRKQHALFLLDEPDTHLNPHWQHGYLDLIKEWTEVAADESTCHIVMTSHNPLTIAALEKEEVRIMAPQDDGKITINPPYVSPRGMGFTSTLTEIFGLPTSLDTDTQRKIDDRNELLKISHHTEEQSRQLIEINDKLNRLGFMFEDREPLYNQFLLACKDVRFADKPPLTPPQIEERRKAMAYLIRNLQAQPGGAA